MSAKEEEPRVIKHARLVEVSLTESAPQATIIELVPAPVVDRDPDPEDDEPDVCFSCQGSGIVYGPDDEIEGCLSCDGTGMDS